MTADQNVETAAAGSAGEGGGGAGVVTVTMFARQRAREYGLMEMGVSDGGNGAPSSASADCADWTESNFMRARSVAGAGMWWRWRERIFALGGKKASKWARVVFGGMPSMITESVWVVGCGVGGGDGGDGMGELYMPVVVLGRSEWKANTSSSSSSPSSRTKSEDLEVIFVGNCGGGGRREWEGPLKFWAW